jgi:CheY-like chemotaxis protein
MTVLVADDSPVVRYTLVRELRKAGIEPACVATAAEALSVDASLTCALLDLDLGDAPGTAVAEELRARDPSLPIAFFTASREIETAAAFGPVFAKPHDLADAVAWVSACSARH